MAYAKWPPAGFMPHAPFVQEAMLRLTGGETPRSPFLGYRCSRNKQLLVMASSSASARD